MLVEETVLAVSNPAAPGDLFPSDRLGVVQSNDDDRRFYPFKGFGILWRSVQECLPCIRPDIAVFGGESTNGWPRL